LRWEARCSPPPRRPPATAAVATEEESGGASENFHNIVRGFANILTGFLEVPRGMVYRNSQMPLWGLVSGAVEGVGLTAIRAVSGVTDIIFLGFDYGNWFNDSTFREYVWKSDWLPREL